MSLDKTKHGDILVLAPRKDLSGGEETRELERAIQESLSQGSPKSRGGSRTRFVHQQRRARFLGSVCTRAAATGKGFCVWRGSESASRTCF